MSEYSENEEMMSASEQETPETLTEAETAETESSTIAAGGPAAQQAPACPDCDTAAQEQGESEPTAAPATGEREKPSTDLDGELFDKVNRAARLLRNRRSMVHEEAEADGARLGDLIRALKLLELKPRMEQKEIADLLGMRLREVDDLLRSAEKHDIVGRIEPEEDDMRKVVVFASEDAIEIATAQGKKRKKLVPQLSAEVAERLISDLAQVIDPLVAMGLDEDRDNRGDRGGRGGFGGRDDRGGSRGGFGGRGGRDDRGSHGGFGGRDDRGPRRDFGGRDDRGGRGGFGGRDDRGGSRGGFGGRDDRGPRRDFGGHDDRGGRGGYRG
ncbi:hypothetical protein Corgl_1165 [Coriobacterium glomerans PW2]|uniref:HTH marR-type domain-containing protein n=1 Tax=Coriobacterium glomerans (strain ATCC 49209 / DSM 20642 / JCM 10262 / PW2) TaxID=700015 RepID=F2N888_CORGP|nr:hypothetical protein [Coriobacterium glomerans]AEB07271.1 hypothetical protein Corgl_1165 [Coriobacterium glomerans PW2]